MDLKRSIVFQLEENCEKIMIFLALSEISWRLSGYNAASFWTCFGPAVWWKGSGSAEWDLRHREMFFCFLQDHRLSKWFNTGTYLTPGTLNNHFWQVLLWLRAGTLKLESWSLKERVRSHNQLSKCLCWEFAPTEMKLDMQKERSQLICGRTY